MSLPLVKSLQDNINRLITIQHTVKSSGFDLGFDQEQLSYQLEGLVFELGESVDTAIKTANSLLGD
jgi:hypothetical protein